jgi:hypothetical protein
VRGLARAVVGLLQTGVDFTCGLGRFTAHRYDGGPASGGSVGVARNDHHHAALGQLHPAAKRRHELDTTAGGLEYTAEISGLSGWTWLKRYGR